MVNSNYLPAISLATGSSTNPFVAPPLTPVLPFSAILNNIQAFAVDHCSVDYIHTESMLNTKGKFTSTVFYEAPNSTWRRNGNLFNTAAISITDS